MAEANRRPVPHGPSRDVCVPYEHLDQQIAAAQQQLVAVRKRARGRTRQPSALRQALEDLTTALADLRRRAQELRACNEALAQRETTLRESEARARAILDAAVDGIVTIDERGLIRWLNPAAERLFGYAAAEVVGRDVNILMPSPWRDEHDRFLARYLAGGEPKVIGIGREVLGRRKDGTTFSADLAVSELQLHGCRLFTGTVRDVTERKRAERRLAAQYAVTRVLAESNTLADAIPKMLRCICEGVGWDVGEFWRVDTEANLLRWDGMWDAAANSGTEFGAVSRGMTFPPGEGLPGRVWDTNRPAWVDDVLAGPGFVRAVAAAHRGLRGTLAFPVRTGGAVIGVMVFFSCEVRSPDHELLEMLDALGNQIGDFIARKRAQEALRESDRRFALFMQNLPGVAFMKDTQGRYVYVNELFESTFHHRGWVGKTDDEFWSPATASQFKQNDSVVLASGKAIQTIEVVPHDDGLHSWLVSKFPILNESGEPMMVGGVGVDITEREQAESKLRELQRLAHQRERLADIGAITAQIVHDLGNPLAGVSMQAQLIVRRAQRDESQPVSTILGPMERIVAEVHRLDALIKEFLDFSREQRLDLKNVDVRRFLQSVVDLWEPLASARGIALTLEVADDIPTITADEEKLHRVFENLVKNAVEAIDQGPGRVRLRAVPVGSDQVRICVEDTGPGIPQELEVFRLFETTKPYGSGLGLPIVRQIVLAHGGGIGFARLEPHGTVFNIELACGGPAE
jgi:PAS domain S-box-containing protein